MKVIEFIKTKVGKANNFDKTIVIGNAERKFYVKIEETHLHLENH